MDSITYGKRGTEYTVAAFTVVSHTEISLTTVPGVGANLRFVVTVAGQSSAPSTPTMSYAAPVIVSVSPVSASTSSNPSSPTVITVVGRNFGLLDSTAFVTVMFGNQFDETRVSLGSWPACVRLVITLTAAWLNVNGVVPQVGPLDVLSRSPKWDDAASVAAHTPGNDHTITFALPSGLGPERGVVVRVNSRSMATYRASDPASFSFDSVFLDYVEVSTVPKLSASPTASEQAESDFVDNNFEEPRAEIRRLVVNGNNFGPCQSCRSDGGTDAVSRVVLVQELNEDLVPLGDFMASNAKMFTWDHSQIVMYSTIRWVDACVSCCASCVHVWVWILTCWCRCTLGGQVWSR